MDGFISKLQGDYPSLTFVQGETACWSPQDNQVFYTYDPQNGVASVLHELAHALLGHKQYSNDLDLLYKEVAAWTTARHLAERYKINIDDNHIQDCLDTYRDWLHKRSTCPVCHLNGLQTHIGCYRCLNCEHSWNVSDSRLCRPYRRSQKALNI